MTTSATHIRFDSPDLLAVLAACDDRAFDQLGFGVIGLDPSSDARVTTYNAFESRRSGLTRNSVMGHSFFAVVAQCMNNFMVAQRFEDARTQRSALDETLRYVLTLRMRPTPVVLRLLASPTVTPRFIVVDWPADGTPP